VCEGQITHRAVAEALGKSFRPPADSVAP
jgi:hypothetical protein